MLGTLSRIQKFCFNSAVVYAYLFSFCSHSTLRVKHTKLTEIVYHFRSTGGATINSKLQAGKISAAMNSAADRNNGTPIRRFLRITCSRLLCCDHLNLDTQAGNLSSNKAVRPPKPLLVFQWAQHTTRSNAKSSRTLNRQIGVFFKLISKMAH